MNETGSFSLLTVEVIPCLFILFFLFSLAAFAESVDYGDADNWAYFAVGSEKDADLLLICPTVDMRDEYNMSIDDEETRQSFLGALNMERGIYEDSTRMYAPYYRQAAMKVYDLACDEREA